MIERDLSYKPLLTVEQGLANVTDLDQTKSYPSYRLGVGWRKRVGVSRFTRQT